MFRDRTMLLVSLPLTCAAVIVGCTWAGSRPEGSRTTSVSSAKFVSIYDDKGVIFQRNTYGDGLSQVYDHMREHTTSAGQSEILLAQGQDFEYALCDTHKILFGFQQADPVYRNTEKDCWLYVSLGATTGGSRNVGPVHIDRKDSVITFEYGPESVERGGFFRGYAYWVPLGRLATGTYTLQLLPRGGKRPTLSRVVTFCDL